MRGGAVMVPNTIAKVDIAGYEEEGSIIDGDVQCADGAPHS